MEMPKVDNSVVFAIIAGICAFFLVKKVGPSIMDKAKKMSLPAATKTK